MYRILLLSIVLLTANSLTALEKSSQPPFKGHESFDSLKPELFTKFPANNSTVRNGVLWIRGESGKKYPPTVSIPIAEKDCTLSFKYRFLNEEKGMIWLFINGDDSFGGYDHILRVKLTKKAVAVQIDGHTKDPKHPEVQEGRKSDPVSGAYRYSEKMRPDKVDLEDSEWHQLELVFKKDEVAISLDGKRWRKKLERPGFMHEKQELSWFLNGGDKGIEIDDVKVISK